MASGYLITSGVRQVMQEEMVDKETTSTSGIIVRRFSVNSTHNLKVLCNCLVRPYNMRGKNPNNQTTPSHMSRYWAKERNLQLNQAGGAAAI